MSNVQSVQSRENILQNLAQSSIESYAKGPAVQSTPAAPQSRIFGNDWFSVDLGPSEGHAGCGSEGTTGVPDRFRSQMLGFDVDLRAACDAHDECSDPLDGRNNRSLLEVAQCQGRFWGDIFEAGGDSIQGRVASGTIATAYTAATSIAALGHWAVGRALDGWDFVRSVPSRLESAWDGVKNAVSNAFDWVKSWF